MLRRSPAWDEVDYLALDLETSGLDPRRDEILAVAIVPVRAGVIRFGERFSSLVRPADPARLSLAGLATHHLLPGGLAGAPALSELLPEVDRRLRGGVLLLHHAPLDVGFLRRAYRGAGLRWPRPPIVDTETLLGRLDERRHLLEPHPAPLPRTLAAARAALALPAHAQHEALADALAMAELFLALRARLGAERLRQLL